MSFPSNTWETPQVKLMTYPALWSFLWLSSFINFMEQYRIEVKDSRITNISYLFRESMQKKKYPSNSRENKWPGVIASIIPSIIFKLFSASRTCAGVTCLHTHIGELIKSFFSPWRAQTMRAMQSLLHFYISSPHVKEEITKTWSCNIISTSLWANTNTSQCIYCTNQLTGE